MHTFCRNDKSTVRIIKVILRLSFVIFLFPLQSSSQNYTGIWVGELKTSGSNLKYELIILEENERLKGYALTSFTNKGLENIGLKSVEIRFKKNALLIEDQKNLYNNYSNDAKRVKIYANLTYQKDTIEILTGTFITRSLDLRSTDSYTGNAFLKKQNDGSDSRLLAKLEELNISGIQSLAQIENQNKNKTNPQEIKAITTYNNGYKSNEFNKEANTEVTTQHKPTTNVSIDDSSLTLKIKDKIDHINYLNPVVKSIDLRNTKNFIQESNLESLKMKLSFTNRKTEIIDEIYFDTDSILVSLFDNGEVDGDTVSLFLNNKEILHKQRLSTIAIKTIIPLTAGDDSLYVIMFAENLGSIPPNTGLLILHLGNEKREIRFSCDMQNNAGLLLKRRKREF